MTHHKPPHSSGDTHYLQDLEKFLETYLVKKAPALPDGLKEFIITVAPWLALIGILLAIPAILAVLGVTTFMTGMGVVMMPMHGLAGWGGWFSIQLIFTAVIMVMEIMALPGLFSRKKKSWTLIFYATLLQFLSSIFFYITAGGILVTILVVYVLFQVKGKYKN